MMFHLNACVSVSFVKPPHPVLTLGLLKVTDPTPIYCSWVNPIRTKNISRPSLPFNFCTTKCLSRVNSPFWYNALQWYPPSTDLCMIEKKLRKEKTRVIWCAPTETFADGDFVKHSAVARVEGSDPPEGHCPAAAAALTGHHGLAKK